MMPREEPRTIASTELLETLINERPSAVRAECHHSSEPPLNSVRKDTTADRVGEQNSVTGPLEPIEHRPINHQRASDTPLSKELYPYGEATSRSAELLEQRP